MRFEKFIFTFKGKEPVYGRHKNELLTPGRFFYHEGQLALVKAELFKFFQLLAFRCFGQHHAITSAAAHLKPQTHASGRS